MKTSPRPARGLEQRSAVTRLIHTNTTTASGVPVAQVQDGTHRYWIDRDGWWRFARFPWPDDGRSYPHGKARSLLGAVRRARRGLLR